MLANLTSEIIVTLSEKLTGLTRTLSKVFYASEGSSAVEIAMKMSLHARKNQGENQRKLFIALENSYHGETIGALSVSDLNLYRIPYQTMLFPSCFISPLPYVSHVHDKLWHDAAGCWDVIEKKLQAYADITTAIIVEPIVQGAGGMKIYSQDFLKRLQRWTKQNHIHLIADEIMTGLGRTGKMLACQHADIEPDFICLSKGLTSGWLPLSAVLTTNEIYELFYDDYSSGKSFLHSHTYSGNALAASVAIEVLNIIEEEALCQRAIDIGRFMHDGMLAITEKTNKLKQVRSIGAIVAADLVIGGDQRRLGYEICQKATKLGALLRPLGNTLYWLPPLNIEWENLTKLQEITEQAILTVT
jgi:adenosylmethionine-8-amino-7-oxononanoate aminotransferase